MEFGRLKTICFVILVIGILIPNVSGYSYSEDDTTDYSDYGGEASWFAFVYKSLNTDTGIIEVLGQWIYPSTHYAKLYYAMKFNATSYGRVHCSATWTLNYRIIAGKAVGGYAKLFIRYYLLSGSQNELEWKRVFRDTVTYTSGDYEESAGIISEDGSSSVYWDTPLSENTNYYAAVAIYIKLFNGGYAYSYSGEIGDATYVYFDVNEINVWT